MKRLFPVKKKGFSLVEVLVFVTILSLFFVTAVAVTVFNLKNLKIQEHKIIATRLAEEGIEWAKQEKEDDWQIFITHSNSYCLNSSPLDWSVNTDCGSDYSLGPPNIFNRVLNITGSGNPVNSVTAVSTVSWLENGAEQTVIIKSILNLWE